MEFYFLAVEICQVSIRTNRNVVLTLIDLFNGINNSLLLNRMCFSTQPNLHIQKVIV